MNFHASWKRLSGGFRWLGFLIVETMPEGLSFAIGFWFACARVTWVWGKWD